MKTIFFRSIAATVPLIAISFLVRAQSALPYVIAGAGGTGTLPGGTTFNFTVGEPFVATIGTNPKFTQGFQQPTTSDAPLPVSLIRFEATREGSTAQLYWATTEETNSDRFEIEHSVNTKIWTEIGTVKSTGESKALLEYQFVHYRPENGQNFYRLKMVDRDGTFAYSRMRNLRFEGLKDVSIYPNPVTDKFFIRDFNKASAIRIINAEGKSVYQSSVVRDGEVNVSKLATGIHVVEITWLDGPRTAQKILIEK